MTEIKKITLPFKIISKLKAPVSCEIKIIGEV